jgi:glycosyltransferase involved in cell wall biosynthesis
VRVTVLTPTLNAERFLPDCLGSLRAQTLPRDCIEHLVLDGESRDGTVGLARAAGATVSVAKDSSLYEAMNRGVRLATGDVIGWLNADDVYTPDALEQVVRTFERTPATEVVVGDYELAYPHRMEVVHSRVDALARIRQGGHRNTWIAPIAVFFRAETLRRLGAYATRYRVAADLDLWIRAAARTPLPAVAHARAILGTFRIHESSLSAGTSPERSLGEAIEIGREWAGGAHDAGIRRYGLHVRRRSEFELMRWQTRNDAAPRRLRTAVRTFLALRRLGPGALDDLGDHVVPLAMELLRGGTGRSGT